MCYNPCRYISFLYIEKKRLVKSFANQVRKKCCLDFKLSSSRLQCSGCVQYKNGVHLVEVSMSDKPSGQTVRLIEIKTVVLLYLVIAA